jgi:hypothetical protein
MEGSNRRSYCIFSTLNHQCDNKSNINNIGKELTSNINLICIKLVGEELHGNWKRHAIKGGQHSDATSDSEMRHATRRSDKETCDRTKKTRGKRRRQWIRRGRDSIIALTRKQKSYNLHIATHPTWKPRRRQATRKSDKDTQDRRAGQKKTKFYYISAHA